MIPLRPPFRCVSGPLLSGVLLACCGIFNPALQGQQDKHGRGYKAPPPTATVQITVEKAANDKPLSNASVIFRAVRNDDVSANLEMKTDPEGHASIDLLEVGSHVTVQVIAGGYATYASGFDLTADGKQILVKLQRPRAQVSVYGEDTDKPAESHPGVQERPKAAANSTPAKSTSANGTGSMPGMPLAAPGMPSGASPQNMTAPTPSTTPPTTPGSNTVPSTPGSPQ